MKSFFPLSKSVSSETNLDKHLAKTTRWNWFSAWNLPTHYSTFVSEEFGKIKTITQMIQPPLWWKSDMTQADELMDKCYVYLGYASTFIWDMFGHTHRHPCSLLPLCQVTQKHSVTCIVNSLFLWIWTLYSYKHLQRFLHILMWIFLEF